jgi:hypothetical protein
VRRNLRRCGTVAKGSGRLQRIVDRHGSRAPTRFEGNARRAGCRDGSKTGGNSSLTLKRDAGATTGGDANTTSGGDAKTSGDVHVVYDCVGAEGCLCGGVSRSSRDVQASRATRFKN